MIIDCISDLHGHYPNLEGGDLLIVSGDLTARDISIDYGHFASWMDKQNYVKKVLIAGNHDGLFSKCGFESIRGVYLDINVDYLCDSGTEFEGIKIWGSPWTSWFNGVNPSCKAFMRSEGRIASKFSIIPDDIDILVTHSPPYGVFDVVNKKGPQGSESLREHVMQRIKPKLHVFGHIHEWGGKVLDTIVTKFVNASHVDENYQPVNRSVRIVL